MWWWWWCWWWKNIKRKRKKRNSISRRMSFLCENKTQTREMIVKVLSEREFFFVSCCIIHCMWKWRDRRLYNLCLVVLAFFRRPLRWKDEFFYSSKLIFFVAVVYFRVIAIERSTKKCIKVNNNHHQPLVPLSYYNFYFHSFSFSLSLFKRN